MSSLVRLDVDEGERDLVIELLHKEANYRRGGAQDPNDLSEIWTEYYQGWITEAELNHEIDRSDRTWTDLLASGNPFDDLAESVEQTGRVEVTAAELRMIGEALENMYGAAEPHERPRVMTLVSSVLHELSLAKVRATLQARSCDMPPPTRDAADAQQDRPPIGI